MELCKALPRQQPGWDLAPTPLATNRGCVWQVGSEIYGPAALWSGFRTPALVRFVSGEDFYLSNTHGGPRMYVNMEDYVSPQGGQANADFLRVVGLFRWVLIEMREPG